jgi:hypothetical protein
MDEKLGRDVDIRTIDFLCKDRPGMIYVMQLMPIKSIKN